MKRVRPPAPSLAVSAFDQTVALSPFVIPKLSGRKGLVVESYGRAAARKNVVAERLEHPKTATGPAHFTREYWSPLLVRHDSAGVSSSGRLVEGTRLHKERKRPVGGTRRFLASRRGIRRNPPSGKGEPPSEFRGGRRRNSAENGSRSVPSRGASTMLM